MELPHGNTEILLMDDKLRHIQGGKGEVYGEIECPAFTGLGFTEACVLLCVTYAELDLESQSVKLHELFPAEGEVSGEIYLRLSVFGIIYCRHNIPVQGPAVESCGKELSLVAFEPELPEDCHVRIGEVHLAVDLLFCTSAHRLVRVCLMDVSETNVITESGDDVESHILQTVDKITCGKISISRNASGYLTDYLLIGSDGDQIPAAEIDGLFLEHIRGRCHRSGDDHAVVLFHITHANGIDLKSMSHRACDTGPIESRAGSASAGFLEEGRINDYRQAVVSAENPEDCVLIYPCPVDFFRECLAVGFLGMGAHAFQLGIVEPAGHLQCQAEQFFEDVAETVLHFRRYIFEDRRYGFLKFDGQLCEVHLCIFFYSYGCPPFCVQTVGNV